VVAINVTTIVIDLAKDSFSLHGVDSRQAGVPRLLTEQPPCVIGIMTRRFVALYRKGGKNGSNDAEAICEAGGRLGILC